MKKEIKHILDANVDILTYKADKDFRCLTSTEKALLENNKKIKEYIEQLESREQKLIEKLEEDRREETGYAKWVDSNTKRISSAVTTMISKSQYAKEILEILK